MKDSPAEKIVPPWEQALAETGSLRGAVSETNAQLNKLESSGERLAEIVSGSSRQVETLRRELDDLRSEQKDACKNIEHLKAVAFNNSHVDLIDFGIMKVFMFTDDEGYRLLGEQYKHNFPKRLPCTLYPSQAEAIAPDEPLVSTLLKHLWSHGVEFSYFDVGCQYGSSAMAAAHLILSSGRPNHVYAFDPGVAGTLAQFNILLNHLESTVTYERMAVADGTYPTMIFTELGHSENNRLVNRIRPTETRSYVMMATSIDDYLGAHHITHNLFIKVDTQGGEVEVFAGMADTIRTRCVVCITEFVPDAINSRLPAVEWLNQLEQAGFSIFEIRENDMFLTPAHRVHPVPVHQMAEFVSDVATRPIPFTDLLLLPRHLPGYDFLVQQLAGVPEH